MKPTDSNPADKVPRPISSEQAQKGEGSPDPVLEQGDPRTKVIDKVITPTSVKELEEQTREINERLSEVEQKTPR
ncbi:hypothetical protein SJI00_08285 [Pseudomonas sp. RP23018S]|uniref:hypothetical protein n=1 Tax=Pseudomonas sp. RP23018S TaxID=3096037 RepID=UPI002ACA10D3|nr:hypothetical protein [Pseudomonas sp. RP23018S]MDZ5602769.1 hypothetical protein [Pseudomonas sp. RP23018S]